MKFTVKCENPASVRTGCVILGVFERRKLSDAASRFDESAGGLLTRLLHDGDMDGKSGQTLLVHYPHPAAWSLAFQTNVPDEVKQTLPDEHVAVFIPTTPSPVNGFYFYVRRDEVIELDMSVDAALKAIVSMGVVTTNMKPSANHYPGD